MPTGALKIFALCAITIFCAVATATAQGHSVSGTVIDKENGEGVMGAVVEISPAGSPDNTKYYTTGHGGAFAANGISSGDYRLKITFLGNSDYVSEFSVGGMSVDLGRIIMERSSIEIETIVKKAVSTRTTMMGDTIAYNADAFKVSADAEVEGLLKKMPGINIADGKIEAQGEEVTKVYVDGAEFFGGNIQQALQSIPAQAVERIEVYNKLSDNALASGVDDGEGSKVINIVTRESLNHSAFGKFHVGGGMEPNAEKGISTKGKYTAGGSVNIFNNARRISIMALSNNINRQNLTDDDVTVSDKANQANASRNFSVNSQSGVARADIAAVNYSDIWGKRKRARFESSLFFNHIDAKNNYSINRWYVAPSKIDTMDTYNFAHPDNYTLRFKSRLEWNVATRQKITHTFQCNYTDNSSINKVDSTSLRYGESGYRRMMSGNDGWSRTPYIRNTVQYTYRFKNPGRIFTVSATASYTGNDSDRSYYNFSPSSKPTLEEAMNVPIKFSYSRTLQSSETQYYDINPSWREKLGRNSSISIIYRFLASLRDRDIKAYTTKKDYELDDTRLNTRTSSDASSDFISHRAGLGYRFSKRRNWLSLSAHIQSSTLSTRNRSTGDHTSHSYLYPVYNATLQWTMPNHNGIRVSCNSSVKAPNSLQLIDIWNVNNSQYLSYGNSQLKPYVEHSLYARYTKTSVAHGSTFMIMAKGNVIRDYIGTSIEYSPGQITIDDKKYNPIQVTHPVNLSGFWNAEAAVSFGIPLEFISSNFNISVGGIIGETPCVLNNNKDMMGNKTAQCSATLGSNISENFDFTLGWNGSYTVNDSSLASFNNEYFTQRATATVKIVLPLGFTLSSSCSYTAYNGYTNGFSSDFTLLNAYIGKKMFRRLGELQFGVNDILNQNQSYARYIWAGYTQMRYNSVIGRYYLLRFTYNLRHISRKRTAPPVQGLKLDRIDGEK